MSDEDLTPAFSHSFGDLAARQQPGAKLGVVVVRIGTVTALTCDPHRVVAPVLRGDDVVMPARAGGVVVVFGDAHGIDDAVMVAERVRRLLHRWAVGHGEIADLSAGAAVAVEGENAIAALDRAERALAQARDCGGGRTVARSVSRIPRQANAPHSGSPAAVFDAGCEDVAN